MKIYPGTFITFEGIDYSGKSVQIKRLAEYLEQEGKTVVVLRDPGTTRISEKIRHILLDNDHHEMTKWTELLLYEAARAQMVEETIMPLLQEGSVVLCDRFYDSTTAYQGYGRQLDIMMVERANSIGSCGLVPELTLLIDLDVDAAVKRRLDAGQSASSRKKPLAGGAATRHSTRKNTPPPMLSAH